jgi:plastocyanin
MRKIIPLVLAALVLALLAMPAFGSSTKTVKMGDSFFKPKTLKISKGTRVTWNWAGVLKHNVRVFSGPSMFHSTTKVTGSYTHLFGKKGKYVMYCTLHPIKMRMTIIVK